MINLGGFYSPIDFFILFVFLCPDNLFCGFILWLRALFCILAKRRFLFVSTFHKFSNVRYKAEIYTSAEQVTFELILLLCKLRSHNVDRKSESSVERIKETVSYFMKTRYKSGSKTDINDAQLPKHD